MPVLRVVARDKVVQVFPLQRIGLQGEVLIGAKVIDPQGLRPGSFAGRLAVEKQDIGLDSLCIENAGRQA